MAGMDWLYGEKISGNPGHLIVRPLVLEPDTVREIHEMVAEATGSATLQFHAANGVSGEINPDDLEKAPTWQLRRLSVVGDPASGVNVALQDGSWTGIIGPGNYEGLAQEIAQKMNDEGRPRPNLKALAPLLPTIAALGVIATWAWVLVDQRPPLSISAFGTLLAAACVQTFYVLRGQMRPAMPAFPTPGHRIRTMSRLETRQRLADRNAQVKIGAITGIVGLLIGAFGNKVLGWF